MAATRLIALHINKGKTLARCQKDRVDYAENPEKTEDGKFISAYMCDPKSVQEEFLIAKQEYLRITGRVNKGDIIAYQIRQSFKPGEITPEEANKVGYETAMRFTKGEHAFLVTTHTDRHHIHNHIIFNSTSLDCTRKFRDFFLCGLALQKVSDIVCLEHHLSIIKPAAYSERSRREVYPRARSKREELRAVIDEILQKKPEDMDDFLQKLAQYGYRVKGGKHITVRKKDWARSIRLDSLGEGYRQADLLTLISSRKGRKIKRQRMPFDLLIDIQAKMTEGKGAGYERWARSFNNKQMAEVLRFLQDNGIHSMTELEKRADTAAETYHKTAAILSEQEKSLQEIGALKKSILDYAKTRSVYDAYRKAGYSRKFYEAHREEILIHKAAKEAFGKRKVKKLPKVKELNAQYQEILSAKRDTYGCYCDARDEMRKYAIAKKNVELILEVHPEKDERQIEKGKEK